MTISTYLSDIWSATEFGDPELTGYAESQLQRDTRVGVQLMALLSLLMLLIVAVAIFLQGLNPTYLYTVGVLSVLSVHILVSAAYVSDVKALHVLGMSFLTMGALAITFLAHRAGDLNIAMMAAIVMLFIAVLLVPWALREAAAVIGVTYLLLTASLISVPGRFAPESLWVLQTLVLGSSIVVIIIAGRNTFTRKQDIRARFELESAHSTMTRLSMQDHLTGAWNRRYLAQNFAPFASQCEAAKEALHVAALDIDDFKGINDRFGHQIGDEILIKVADTFMGCIGNRGNLVRLGGDEFLILFRGDGLDQVIDSAISDLQNAPVATPVADNVAVTLSAGIASSAPGDADDLDALYKSADHALYAAKQERPAFGAETSSKLFRTGTWHL